MCVEVSLYRYREPPLDAARTDHRNDITALTSVQLAQRRKHERSAAEPDHVERDGKSCEFFAGVVSVLDGRYVGDKDGRVGRTLRHFGSRRQLAVFVASDPSRKERGTVRTRKPVKAITSAIVHRCRSGQFCGCSGDSVHSFCKSTPRLLIASMAVIPSPDKAASSRLSRFGGAIHSADVRRAGLSISAAGGGGCRVAISGAGEVKEGKTRPE